MKKSEKRNNMVNYSFRIDKDLLQRLRDYAIPRRISMGYIIRRLLEKYLEGEIKLD